jgi:hypothetical protein
MNFDINEDDKIENNARIDQEYAKKFGHLYKTFDVRFIKGKILETISEVV